jgi:hypothetical protein
MRWLVFIAILLLASCSGRDTLRPEDRGTRRINYPNGKHVRAEVRMRPDDIIRGAMFRDSLPGDRGILLLYKKNGNYQQFLYQVKIPLDVVWFNEYGVIVELVSNAMPCPEGTRASQCPVYGGQAIARTVLLLGGGSVGRFGLQKGMKVDL